MEYQTNHSRLPDPHTGATSNEEYLIGRAVHPLFLAQRLVIDASTILRQSFPAWAIVKSFDQVGVLNVKD